MTLVEWITFPHLLKCLKILDQKFSTPDKIILIWLCFLINSSRGSSKACGGRGPKLHSTEGDVAFPDTRQAARSDPWLPGSLCTGGKWRIEGPSPHQGCHVGWCAGMTIPQFLSYYSWCIFHTTALLGKINNIVPNAVFRSAFCFRFQP